MHNSDYLTLNPPQLFPLFVLKQTFIRLQWSVLISSWKHRNGSEEKGINIPEIYLTQLNGARDDTHHILSRIHSEHPLPSMHCMIRVAGATPPAEPPSDNWQRDQASIACSRWSRALLQTFSIYCLCVPQYNAGVRFNGWWTPIQHSSNDKICGNADKLE